MDSSDEPTEPRKRAPETLTYVDLDSAAVPDGETLARYGAPEDRYALEGLIGEGGMGEVYFGRDRLLARPVAVKFAKSDAAASHFCREALTHARLDHPNIPPVFDLAFDSRGRPMYAMRLIEGRSLREVLESESWSLPRLLNAFLQVLAGVQAAHEQSFLHLDLKPDNIMVGQRGEVYVVDWGLAHEIGERVSGVTGTPGYMSPEHLDASQDFLPASDVYSLGLVLYEMATGSHPFAAESRVARLERNRSGAFDRGAAWQRVRPELREVIARALESDLDKRTASVAQLSTQILEVLDGSRERERKQRAAQRAVEFAQRETREHAVLLAELAGLDRRLAVERPDSWSDEATKRAYWQLEDHCRELRTQATTAQQRALRYWIEANSHDPDDEQIRHGLAEIYWERFVQAEARGDLFQQLFLEAELRGLELPAIEERLSGAGELSIRCEPQPTRATLSRLVEVDRRLQPVDPVAVPTDAQISLPMGRYEIRLEHPEKRTIVAPVLLARGGRVVANSQSSIDWRLRRDDEIGDGFVLVPRGTFIMGGDPATFKSVARGEPFVEEFAIAKHPVTWAEYRDYLDVLAARDPERCRLALPAIESRSQRLFRCGPNGDIEYLNGDTEFDACRDYPIFDVTYDQAIDYIAWRSERDGRSYRLPTDAEWEKAARGTDGRLFPWGDDYDAAFCHNIDSQPGSANPAPVGTFASDRSPYGVRDMAGCIREWCASWFDEKHGTRLVRGGSWNFGEIGARCAYRLGCSPAISYPFIGFRLAHDID